MTKEIRFDFTSNTIKQGARAGIEKELLEHLTSCVPSMVKRQAELPSYITAEVGFYTTLMENARLCYEFGLFHPAVSTICITAERFAIELSSKLQFTINSNLATEKDFYEKDVSQYRRLNLLFKGGIINEPTYNLLNGIRIIRNKYVHPKEKKDAKADSLTVITSFTKIIQSRFSENYTFKEGKIVQRKKY